MVQEAGEQEEVTSSVITAYFSPLASAPVIGSLSWTRKNQPSQMKCQLQDGKTFTSTSKINQLVQILINWKSLKWSDMFVSSSDAVRSVRLFKRKQSASLFIRSSEHIRTQAQKVCLSAKITICEALEGSRR